MDSKTLLVGTVYWYNGKRFEGEGSTLAWDSGALKVPLWHGTVELWMFRSGMGQWSFECSTLVWDSGALNVPLWHGAVELWMFHSGMGQWSFECSTLAWDSEAFNVPLWHGAVELWMFRSGMGQWSFQSSALAWDSVPLWHTAVFHSGMWQWSFECSTMAWGCGALNVPLWHVVVELWMFHYGMEQWLFQVFQLNAVSMYLCISVECGIYAIGKKPVCAPSIFLEASPTLPLTQFQCWSDWPWLSSFEGRAVLHC